MRIGYGTFDPELPEEDIVEWEKYYDFSTATNSKVSAIGFKIFMDCTSDNVWIR